MVDRYFIDPVALHRLHAGPLGAQIDTFAARVAKLGYARSTAQGYLRLAAQLSGWLERRELGVGDLDEQRVEEFFRHRRRQGRVSRVDRAPLRLLLEQLRETGAVSPAHPARDDSPHDGVVRGFGQYLSQERGLSQATLRCYLPAARRFLADRFSTGAIDLAALRSKDVTRFIVGYTRGASPGCGRLMATALRAFFRFLFSSGQTSTDLSGSVPAVAGWRLSELPKSLEPGQLQRLLQSCDRSTATGQRDYAILLLLARLGLRAGEVVSLALEDLDWRAGELSVRGKGSRTERLPIPRDVGEALATYLRQGRPPCSTRRVFVRMRAPRRGFASSVAVSSIVQRALARAGLHTARKGAHLLRHSLATQMLRRGASLAEIGEILRHRLPATTEIYTKVDFGALRKLAQPWPRGGR